MGESIVIKSLLLTFVLRGQLVLILPKGQKELLPLFEVLSKFLSLKLILDELLLDFILALPDFFLESSQLILDLKVYEYRDIWQ